MLVPLAVNRLVRAVRICVTVFLIYAVLRLSIVIGVPAYVLQREWLLGIRQICAENKSICLGVQSERNLVGGWWYGYGLYFTARKGHAEELRQIIMRAAPRDADTTWRTPWRYIGVRVTDAE
jgi:hypothetical protein